MLMQSWADPAQPRRPVSCLLCDDHTRDWPAMLEHLRILHPDQGEVEWPDSGDARADRGADSNAGSTPKRPTAASAASGSTRHFPTRATGWHAASITRYRRT